MFLVVLQDRKAAPMETIGKIHLVIWSLQCKAFVDFLIDDEAKTWFPSSCFWLVNIAL